MKNGKGKEGYCPCVLIEGLYSLLGLRDLESTGQPSIRWMSCRKKLWTEVQTDPRYLLLRGRVETSRLEGGGV